MYRKLLLSAVFAIKLFNEDVSANGLSGMLPKLCSTG